MPAGAGYAAPSRTLQCSQFFGVFQGGWTSGRRVASWVSSPSSLSKARQVSGRAFRWRASPDAAENLDSALGEKLSFTALQLAG